jgi:hypothetical protein
MVPINVAVVPYGPLADAEGGQPSMPTSADLAKVTAALQVQVSRDFEPIWGLDANVACFPALEQVPTGYMTLVLVERLPSIPAGLSPGGKKRSTARHGVHYAAGSRPVALVEYGESWSLLASHELLEMVVDPWGNRTLAGRSLKEDQGQVEYLLEICDPCQGETYLIDGVLVSDFVTPDFYATSYTAGLRYSFLGRVTEPRQVLSKGYLTWRLPGSEEIWQKIGAAIPEPLPSGGLLAALALRPWVDWRSAPSGNLLKRSFPDRKTVVAAQKAYGESVEAAQTYGDALRRDIGFLLTKGAAQQGTADPNQPQGEIELLRALGTSDKLRAAFKRDPARVLAAANVDPSRAPANVKNLAKKDVFLWAADQLEQGDILDGNGFFGAGLWWLRALGGG